jgi:mono/diheme cytochrome c family protein
MSYYKLEEIVMKTRNISKLIGKATGILMLAAGSASFALEGISTTSIGKLEFQKNCASCHGIGGKGNGPFVEFLKQAPSDLTLLSQKNAGIFPQENIYDWIRDASKIRAHGSQDMPIWGERYSEEIIEQFGPMYTGPASSVRQRILELVFYIATIQQKP